ncbi:MAG: MFS transporter [Gulosibacter sp.]|uniref:MFS transporter n=1 Tax=Gulosibacter sp. TaxID=2817531 RepID=UPI003F8F6071
MTNSTAEANVAPTSTAESSPAGLTRLTPRIVLSFIGTMVVAFMGANLVPVLIGAMVGKLGIEFSHAGMIATAMSVASVAAMLVTNRFVARGDRSSIARIGLLLISIGFFGAAIILTVEAVTAGFVIGGIGIGIVLASGTAAQSSTADPDKTVTTVMIINRIGATALLAIAPLFQGDLRAVLITIGLLGVFGQLVASGLPNLPGRKDLPKSAAPTRPVQTIKQGTMITWVGILLAVSMGLWSLTEDMVYSMTSALADRAGISPEVSSLLLAGKVAGGLVGAILAPLALRWIGRSLSLAIIVVVSTVTKFLMITAESPVVYGASILLWGVMYGAVLVLVFGLAAIMDVTGRTAVIVSSVYLTGVAFGPLVGGQLVEAVTPLVYALVVTVPSVIFGTVIFLIARSRRKFEAGNTTAIAVSGEATS